MLKTESYKKGIIFSTGLNIIAKGLYFLNIVIIAFYFGKELFQRSGITQKSVLYVVEK